MRNHLDYSLISRKDHCRIDDHCGHLIKKPIVIHIRIKHGEFPVEKRPIRITTYKCCDCGVIYKEFHNLKGDFIDSRNWATARQKH